MSGDDSAESSISSEAQLRHALEYPFSIRRCTESSQSRSFAITDPALSPSARSSTLGPLNSANVGSGRTITYSFVAPISVWNTVYCFSGTLARSRRLHQAPRPVHPGATQGRCDMRINIAARSRLGPAVLVASLAWAGAAGAGGLGSVALAGAEGLTLEARVRQLEDEATPKQ